MARMVRDGLIVALAAMFVMVVAACDSEDGIDGSLPTTTVGEAGEGADTTQSPETTQSSETSQVPETTDSPTTEAPQSEGATETTVAGSEDTGSAAAVWLIVLGVLVILGIILWVIGRKSGETTTG